MYKIAQLQNTLGTRHRHMIKLSRYIFPVATDTVLLIQFYSGVYTTSYIACIVS